MSPIKSEDCSENVGGLSSNDTGIDRQGSRQCSFSLGWMCSLVSDHRVCNIGCEVLLLDSVSTCDVQHGGHADDPVVESGLLPRDYRISVCSMTQPPSDSGLKKTLVEEVNRCTGVGGVAVYLQSIQIWSNRINPAQPEDGIGRN